MKKLLLTFALLLLSTPIIPDGRLHAASATQSETIPVTTGSTSTYKTYTFPVKSGIDFNSISYSGSGTLTNKYVDQNGNITVRIDGKAINDGPKDIYGSKDSGPFTVMTGNDVWRYSDGATWQLAQLRPADLTQYMIGPVRGQNFVDGVSQSPPNWTVVSAVKPTMPDKKSATWIDWGGNPISPEDVDENTIKLADNVPGGAKPYYVQSSYGKSAFLVPSKPGVIGSEFSIPQTPEIPGQQFVSTTNDATHPITGYTEGRRYIAIIAYYVQAKTKPTTKYDYGGTLTFNYDAGPNPKVSVIAQPTPSDVTFSGSKIPVKLKVDAGVTNLKPEEISKWVLYAHTDNGGTTEREDYSVTLNVQSTDVTNTFDFTIPAALVTGDKYVDKYAVRARVFKSDGTYLDATTAAAVTVNKIPPPPPPTTNNIPPVAVIKAPYSVQAGNKVTLDGTSSYDEDGTIEGYEWDTAGATGTVSGSTGDVYFMTPGTYTVHLAVVDDKGDYGYVDHTISVTAPTPYPWPDYSGRAKENRKITLDASKSLSPMFYPIDWSKTTWEITPVSGGTAADIKYDGTLTGETKDILIKKAGTYKVKLTVWNTFPASATNEMTLIVDPDLPPIPDFDVNKTIFRDPNAGNKALIHAVDHSTSVDGDVIKQRVWSYIFDSDNDGSFDDETRVIVDNTNKQDISFYVSSVGRYVVDLEVTEDFGEPTIQKFILPSDYRKANTWQ